MTAQTSLFDATPVASVRRTDARPAREAAAANQVAKATQLKQILARLHAGPISADTAAQIIDRHRSTASARLGVMARRGLVEPAGEHLEPLAFRRLVVTAIGARRRGPSPRPRVVVPVESPHRIKKEDAPCCVAKRDVLGRLPIGFCGPFCIRRSMRQGETFDRSFATWRDSEAEAS